jgi:phosphate-selective porin OprO/OprP
VTAGRPDGRGAPRAGRFRTLVLLWAALVAAFPIGTQAQPPPEAGMTKTPLAPGSPSPGPPAQDATACPTGNDANALVTRPARQAPLVWDFSWRGWDGLHVSLSRDLPRAQRLPELPVFEADRLRLAARVGGRVEVDAAVFSTTGDLSGFEPGVELRRARITVRGDAVVTLPFTYRVDLGYVPGKFTITEAYVEVPDLPWIGSAKLGIFKPPLGLQAVTSSWAVPLMEIAAPLQALAPGSDPGIEIGRTFAGGRGTWSLGVYGDIGANNEYGNASRNFGNAVGRVTWLALDGIDAERPARNTFLHLGLGAVAQYSPSGQVRYRARPESYIAPCVIDTGTIDADRAVTVGAEAAWVRGRLSLQGESLRSTVDPAGGGRLSFGGAYALASWFLTDDSRPYDRKEGRMASLVPQRAFAFGPEGGWGAVEAVARLSHTDLSDGPVQGGRLTMLMSSLNWYPQRHLRWMLDVGFGRVTGAAEDGRIAVIQTRIGIDL